MAWPARLPGDDCGSAIDHCAASEAVSAGSSKMGARRMGAKATERTGPANGIRRGRSSGAVPGI